MSTKITVTVNRRNLLKEIMSNRRVMGSYIRKELNPLIEKAHARLVDEFVNHPVTKEIEGGVTASNQSGTLGGYGNLFSFIIG